MQQSAVPALEPEPEIEPASQPDAMTGTAAQIVADLFDASDADGSGYLDAGEGKRFLRLQGCREEELEYYWDDVLRVADENKDGKISKGEFLAYMLGHENLDRSGGFADEERAAELNATLRALQESALPAVPRPEPEPEPAPPPTLQCRPQQESHVGTASLQVDQLQVDELRIQLSDLKLQFEQLQGTLRVTEEDHKHALQQLQDVNQILRAEAEQGEKRETTAASATAEADQ
eukprot:COSAG03_NODE_7471_length_913_cov_1.664619_1_plen_232_part_01